MIVPNAAVLGLSRSALGLRHTRDDRGSSGPELARATDVRDSVARSAAPQRTTGPQGQACPRTCLSIVEPEQGGGQDDAASVDQDVLVVAGGQAAPVLELVERSLDDVAVAVAAGVEVDRSATAGATSPAVADLVGRLRDDGPDTASA